MSCGETTSVSEAAIEPKATTRSDEKLSPWIQTTVPPTLGPSRLDTSTMVGAADGHGAAPLTVATMPADPSTGRDIERPETRGAPPPPPGLGCCGLGCCCGAGGSSPLPPSPPRANENETCGSGAVSGGGTAERGEGGAACRCGLLVGDGSGAETGAAAAGGGTCRPEEPRRSSDEWAASCVAARLDIWLAWCSGVVRNANSAARLPADSRVATVAPATDDPSSDAEPYDCVRSRSCLAPPTIGGSSPPACDSGIHVGSMLPECMSAGASSWLDSDVDSGSDGRASSPEPVRAGAASARVAPNCAELRGIARVGHRLPILE